MEKGLQVPSWRAFLRRQSATCDVGDGRGAFRPALGVQTNGDITSLNYVVGSTMTLLMGAVRERHGTGKANTKGRDAAARSCCCDPLPLRA